MLHNHPMFLGHQGQTLSESIRKGAEAGEPQDLTKGGGRPRLCFWPDISELVHALELRPNQEATQALCHYPLSVARPPAIGARRQLEI